MQYLAGHADPRTMRIYDRRRKITRCIVDRIVYLKKLLQTVGQSSSCPPMQLAIYRENETDIRSPPEIAGTVGDRVQRGRHGRGVIRGDSQDFATVLEQAEIDELLFDPVEAVFAKRVGNFVDQPRGELIAPQSSACRTPAGVSPADTLG